MHKNKSSKQHRPHVPLSPPSCFFRYNTEDIHRRFRAPHPSLELFFEKKWPINYTMTESRGSIVIVPVRFKNRSRLFPICTLHRPRHRQRSTLEPYPAGWVSFNNCSESRPESLSSKHRSRRRQRSTDAKNVNVPRGWVSFNYRSESRSESVAICTVPSRQRSTLRTFPTGG